LSLGHGHSSDVIILGSGLAGLSCAKYIGELDPNVKISIITKGECSETNTFYAQGGMASVSLGNGDDFEQHIQDTLIAGDGECNQEVVEMVVNRAPSAIADLVKWGVHFDETGSGQHHLALEGGHSKNRVVHRLDTTGKEIQSVLSKAVESQNNVIILEKHFVTDLLITQGPDGEKICHGVALFNEEADSFELHYSPMVIMATGGVGQIFASTTNAKVATGDGIGITNRAEGEIENMHLIQFHPTALHVPSKGRMTLISEAVRGSGAHLLNYAGERFMLKYHPSAELAPRDIVSRAIINEMKNERKKHLYLDCRHMPKSEFKLHFPSIHSTCISIGLDPKRDLIPVSPAAHYSCGGINIDKSGKSSIIGMLACGECSSTGLHGANRLASNSLTEAIVYARICAITCLQILDQQEIKLSIKFSKPKNPIHPIDPNIITNTKCQIQALMASNAGAYRNSKDLRYALHEMSILKLKIQDLLNNYHFEIGLGELRNMVHTAELVLKDAVRASSNKGVHYNTDLDVRERVF
jgi:L-aspartate oxidase